jgi:hypothetical protein
MALEYEGAGYDRQTGRLAVSYDVSAKKIVVKQIAGIRSSDDGLGSCQIGLNQIAEIAKALKTGIEQGRYDFFLEPYEEPDSARGNS